MPVIYIKEQGAYIKKRSRHIVIEKSGHVLLELPLHDVTGVSVIGNVQITTQAIHLLLNSGISISFFSYSGNYLGSIAAESSKNVFLRIAQYELYQDMDYRMNLAGIIVRNKVRNQISIIQSYRWTGIDYDYHHDIKELEKLITLLDSKTTSNEIMGIEGKSSAVYFSAFGHMLKSSIRFEKRNRRPPRDPVNVILSLGYTFLTKEISSILDSEFFDNYLGFLHGIRYGRKSLALDLVEEFRQPVVDRLVIRLFNKRILSEFDFDALDGKVILTKEGFSTFCREYEKWMKAPVSEADSRSFRTIIKVQVSQLKVSIKEGKHYQPFEWGKQIVSDQL